MASLTQERTKTGLKLYVPPSPPPRPLAPVVPSQLGGHRSMQRYRGKLYGNAMEEQVKPRRPISRNRPPWDSSVNHDHSYYRLGVEDQIRQKVGMVASRHKVLFQQQQTESSTEFPSPLLNLTHDVMWEKAQPQQQNSSSIHNRKSPIDAAKKRKSKNCSLNSVVLSNDCPLAKEAGSKCCKGGSELSLDIINGQDGMEESSTNTNELEKLCGRLDILESSTLVCQNSDGTMALPIGLEEENISKYSTSLQTDGEEEMDDTEIHNESTATAITLKTVLPGNGREPDKNSNSVEEEGEVDENYSEKTIERIATASAAASHDDPKSTLRCPAKAKTGDSSSVVFSATAMANQLNDAKKMIREQQLEIMELRRLLARQKTLHSTLSTQMTMAALDDDHTTTTPLRSQQKAEEGHTFQKSRADVTSVPDDHWGAALAAVDRLLSCTSSSDNVTNGEKAITSNPRNNGDSASSVKDTAASSVVKEWQLIGARNVGPNENKNDMKPPPSPQQAPQPVTTTNVISQASKPNAVAAPPISFTIQWNKLEYNSRQPGKAMNSHHRALHQGGHPVEDCIVMCPTSSIPETLLR